MDPQSDPHALLAHIERSLCQGWSRIDFGDPLERLYRLESERARFARVAFVICVSLILNDLFVFPETAMMPDATGFIWTWHFGILTPSTLVSLALMRRRVISISTAAVFFLAMVLLGSMGMMSLSRAPDAILMAFAASLLMVYGTVFPLSFRHALAFSAMSLSVIPPSVALHPGFTDAARVFAVGVTLCMAFFIVLATYQFEKSDRRNYLLLLRETLQATLLIQHNETLSTLSLTDGLTGLGNRRLFDATLDRLWPASGATKTPIGLLMIDVDHFKRLNDTHGHLCGDACLRALAEMIRRQTRGGDAVVCRYGGEEFAVICDGADLRMSVLIAEQMRAAVEAAAIPIDERPGASLRMTVSIGVAAAREGASIAGFIAQADAALYKAKLLGRNRVCSDDVTRHAEGETWAA